MVTHLHSSMRLETAETIIDAALAEGERLGLLPLTVAVLDSGGQLVAYRRQDGSGIMRGNVAIGKAWGALGMGLNAATINQRMSGNPGFLTGLIGVSDGRLAPNFGGVLVLDSDGLAIGAVGISGDTGENDELAARAGIKSAGLCAAET